MRKILLLVFILTNVCTLLANPISEEIAKKAATNYMNKRLPNRLNRVNELFTEAYNGVLVYYILNFEEGGWIIVSAVDNTTPVLGYSFDGIYDKNTPKPPAFISWTDNYKKQIFEAKSKNISNIEVKNKWDALLVSKNSRNLPKYTPGTELLNDPNRGEVNWAQDKNNSGGCTPSYNVFCPSTNNNSCDCDHKPVGCGAVALGQIMWYWQWPNISSHRYHDWELMPNELLNSSTSAEGYEIANLLRDIGNSSNMIYWCIGSWTTMNKLVDAFIDDFKYKSVEKKVRDDWSDNVWCDLIRAEIDVGRPVAYRGDKSDLSGEKHYFVVDGYDAIDPELFHINWGWSSHLNGYFNFNDLTPGNSNFNKNQRAIIGISPTCAEAPFDINNVPYTIVTDFKHELARNNISLPDFGKNLSVEDGGKLILTAGNSVSLKAGFIAKKRSSFRAEPEQISFSQMGIEILAWTYEFSPNGDGVNDELCFEVNNANTWEFQAFNINGGLVFQSAGTISENSVCVWDGTGSSSNLSVYICIVKFRNSCGEIIENTYPITVVNSRNRNVTNITSTINTLNSTHFKLSNNQKYWIESNEVITNKVDQIVNIYPNPNHGIFKISTKGIQFPYELKCTDQFGKLVFERQGITSNIYEINIESVPNGIYTLQICTSNKIINRKLIISSNERQ